MIVVVIVIVIVIVSVIVNMVVIGQTVPPQNVQRDARGGHKLVRQVEPRVCGERLEELSRKSQNPAECG